jgi:TnpA family transposase
LIDVRVDQAEQAACLTLLTNAVVLWNTVYMAAAIDQLTQEGLIDTADAQLVHLDLRG